MDLSIIIVNYKSKDKLINCLNSIASSDLDNIKYEIIIVDNASGDNLLDINNNFENLNIIYSNKNLGMGAGNNLGISNSRGNYILISNPDIVYKKDTIKNLYQTIENNENYALVGPKLLNPDNSLQYSVAKFPKIYLPFLRRTAIGKLFPKYLNDYFLKSEDYDKIKEVDWLLGACFIVRRHQVFLKSAKLFDERFFMYFEDIDLCRRIREKNYKVIYYPDAIAVHDHTRASARLIWYKAIFKDKLAREHLKSWFLYFLKWKFK